MKKLLCILVVLVSLAAVPAMAEKKPESFYYGTWICIAESDPEITLTAVTLQKRGEAYVLSLKYSQDVIVKESAEIRKWSVTDDGIRLTRANGKKTELQLTSDDELGSYSGMSYSGYIRYRNSIKVKTQQDSDSFEVPKGIYIIGEDIPAGNWRIELRSNSTFIGVYSNQSAFDEGLAYFSEVLSGSDTVVGKLPLKDGNIIELTGNVLFVPYKGFGK